jgi:hypothetical protein
MFPNDSGFNELGKLKLNLFACKIRGFHGGDYEEFRVLGCYTVWLL